MQPHDPQATPLLSSIDDPAQLRKLDRAALAQLARELRSFVLESVSRTGRLVVVDNAWRSGGPGAEVVARVAELALDQLDAQHERVGAVEVPVPYPRHLEEAALPSASQVAAAARRAVG